MGAILVDFQHLVDFGGRGARRIHDDQVVWTLFGSRDGMEDDGRGVGARLLLYHRDPGSVRPDLELLDGGCAEGIPRPKHRRTVLLVALMRELRDDEGRADPLNA